ncbi:MAG: methylated-DNA--[protein]-cysteine S-methyltransferase [Chlamydiales bacterium]
MTKKNTILYSHIFSTPLGSMIAIANKKNLCALQFVDEGALKKKIHLLAKQLQATINLQQNVVIDVVKRELQLYFEGKLKKFTVPIDIQGSLFQKLVWSELQNIPFAATKSYSDIACCIDKPGSHRAIGRANGANRFVIIIPCHRVIYIDSTIGGYTGGIGRKQWLLHHERQTVDS